LKQKFLDPDIAGATIKIDMDNMNLPICIFSGHRPGMSYLDKDDVDMYIERELKGAGIPFKQMIGHYKGTNEVSYLVPLKYQIQVEALCILLEQESYLVSHSDRLAELHYPTTGEVERLPGKLQEISPSQVESGSFESWTYCPALNQYFGVW